ncbi:MAG: ATP-binding protein [Lachnospiraceae bacterium]|nr:ATP-binding protein [Lachnospiraceae bacterium]
MIKLIDREIELKTLKTEYDRKGSSFVVIYGRRRIGKTTLINKFCEDKKSIHFLATEESENENLREFQNVVAEELNNNLLKSATVRRWEDIFDVIADAADEKKKLVVTMDEFQYIGKANPAFPSIMMKIWDKSLKDKNIMLIICGSLINMLTSQVLSYDSPLYGRRTAQLNMKQIPFSYYKDFVPGLSEDEIIKRYAVTGGVPKYIEIFSDEKDIYKSIKNNILSKNSFLYAEPEFLLQKEVSEIGSYFSLLKTIAAGNHKLSSIATVMNVKQTSLSKYLNVLINLDLIERQVPITEENPEKSKKGLYYIKDNFIKFWFQFIYANRGLLEAGKEQYVEDKIKKNFIDNHVSFVYEDICREKTWNLISDKISFNRVGRWWDKNTEIDIVAYDSNGKDIVFGECKYTDKPKDIDIYYELKKKCSKVNWHNIDRVEHFVFFSKAGYTNRMQKLAEEDNNINLY